jgi:hypothetical protein
MLYAVTVRDIRRQHFENGLFSGDIYIFVVTDQAGDLVGLRPVDSRENMQ